MNGSEELAIIERQEELLQFDHFSNDDALALGLLIKDLAETKYAPVAIEIEVNGLVIFHFNMTGAKGRYSMWVRRKINMVRAAQVSSLRGLLERERDGKDLKEDWGLDPSEYAAIGGGFPIALRGTGIIGAAAVSGLPHRDDHALVVEAISKFLGVAL